MVFFTGDPPETKSIWDDFMLWFILGGSVFFILIILAIITVSVTVDRLCKGVVNKPPVERFFPHVQVHSVDEGKSPVISSLLQDQNSCYELCGIGPGILFHALQKWDKI